jgi:D-3-phosphoglycerate dehydrogenase / 2-oxoglutarate reductase
MKISVHTNLNDLNDVRSTLSGMGTLSVLTGNGSYKDALRDSISADVIFTNPNNLGFRYSEDFIERCLSLKYFVTASTGLDHVDINALRSKGITLVCLRNDTEFMSKVTATAEHAVCLTLVSLRNIPVALSNISERLWSWENCVGRQLSCMKIGVLGFGRLGGIYASVMRQMSGELLIYDPLENGELIPTSERAELQDIHDCDVISIHVHLIESTRNMINADFLSQCKPNVTIVNTSRGGIVDEHDLAEFLKLNPNAKYATDVLADELSSISTNPLLDKCLSKQVVITPHIGGMTLESRKFAYGRAVELLVEKVTESQ